MMDHQQKGPMLHSGACAAEKPSVAGRVWLLFGQKLCIPIDAHLGGVRKVPSSPPSHPAPFWSRERNLDPIFNSICRPESKHPCLG